MKQFDITIVGAGPAGCTLALALKNSGLRVALLDKATFPRDKTCGDAIPYEAYQTLKAIDEKYYRQLYEISDKNYIRFNRLITAKNQDFTIKWTTKAFNCKRLVFDNVLFNWVKNDTKTTILENTTFKSATLENDDIWIIETNKTIFQTKILVGAGGANCPIARRIAKIELDRKNHSGVVRAYYKGIEGLNDEVNEIYFIKEYPDSYFWIFPVDKNIYNVGFGLLSQTIADKQLNLRELFEEIILNSPNFKERFRNAERLDKVKGFGIPLGGTRKIPISGKGFLLIGDAAGLVEPVGGHGIGTGVWSGKIAADFLLKAFQTEDFSKKMMYQYDTEIEQTIGKRLANQAKLQRIILRSPWLVELAAKPFMKKVIDWLAYR
jgi:geranylgeranyl reductase family protein